MVLLGAFGHLHNNRQKIVHRQKSIGKRMRTITSKNSVDWTRDCGAISEIRWAFLRFPCFGLHLPIYWERSATTTTIERKSYNRRRVSKREGEQEYLKLLCLVVVQTLETQEMPTGLRLQVHHVFSNQKNFSIILSPSLSDAIRCVHTIFCLLCWSWLKVLSNCQVVVQTPETQEMPNGFVYSSTITSPINRILDNLVRLLFPMLSRVCTIF
jgi:hypothetical protein